MQQLIPFEKRQIGTETIETVDGRDLHAGLEIGKDYTSWVKVQVKSLRLVESRDFVVFTQKGENLSGGRPTREYFFTFDASKHIAMASRSDKGYEVREYFIACEQELKKMHTALPERTAEQKLSLIKQAADLLERFGHLDGRDELFFADCTRNISRGELAPAQPLVPSPHPTPASPAKGASISDRLYVLAPQLTQKEHRSLSIEGGKRCAAEHRSRHKGNDPEKFMQFIDGATRPVAWYSPKDWEWVDTILQMLVARTATAQKG